jgi:hypothetical protein
LDEMEKMREEGRNEWERGGERESWQRGREEV